MVTRDVALVRVAAVLGGSSGWRVFRVRKAVAVSNDAHDDPFHYEHGFLEVQRKDSSEISVFRGKEKEEGDGNDEISPPTQVDIATMTRSQRVGA